MQGKEGRGRTELAGRNESLRVPGKVPGFPLTGHVAAAKGNRAI